MPATGTSDRRARGRWAGLLVCVLLTSGWLLVAAPPAAAHAVLVSSSPAAGATLGATPGVVVLHFDETLVHRLSRATVVDPTGQEFPGTVSGTTVRVPLPTNAPGVYRVDWTTVSVVDGHTITGTFRFGVGVPAGATAADAEPGPSRGDLVVAAVRTTEYAVLLLAIGLATLRWLRRDLPAPLPAVPVATALLVSGAAVVLAEVALATSGVSATNVVDYLTIGLTGWARLASVAFEAGVLVLAVVRGRLSLLLLAAVVGSVAVAGHAANVDPPWAGVTVNAVHLAATGVWAGGIMALALVRLSGRWPRVGRSLLPSFSRVAPWAFLVSVGTGLLQATQLLGGPGQVLGTAYGRTLLVKSLAVAAMVPLSLLAWRRLRVMVRGEAAVALVVVAAAALLAAYPVVPREAGEEEESGQDSAPAAQESPFPRPGDLTVAGRAGDTLVGLSVHPGRPGPNQVLAYLAPAPRTGEPVVLSVGDASPRLRTCGGSCRRTTVDLRGGERLSLTVAGSAGGTASFVLPALPAPDGTAQTRRAMAWMNDLDSYHVDEVLSGIRSTYDYARPHAMRVRTWYDAVARDTVWLGSAVYTRPRPRDEWSREDRGAPAPVPYFVWNPFTPLVDTAVLGRGTVGHVPVTRVSAFGGHGDDPEPVWFTLWIDARNRVLRSQMWAPNHFMDDHYRAFDAPVDIARPPAR